VHDDDVLLSRRAREPWRGHWEIPGGYVDQGEHPMDAARREVREEVGVDVGDLELVDVLVHEWSPGEWVQNTVYVARVGADLVVRADPAEVTECRWFPLADLPAEMALGQRECVARWAARH
jgi:ADP-ribose pyrophosphatase YjhB (NUDIX family)